MSDHTDETPETVTSEIVTSEVGPESSDERPTPIPAELPVLPLRDTVLFPNSFMPLAVARESSVRLIDEAIAGGKLIGVFAQRDPALDEPIQADLYEVGTATHIHKMFRLPDGSLRLIVQGLSRIRLDEIVAVKPYLRAAVSAVNDNLKDEDRLEIDALLRNIKSNFQKVVSLSPLLSDDLQTLAMNIEEPARLADFIASSLSTISTATKQEVLETLDIRARMDSLNRILIKELEVLELGSKIQSQVQSEVGRNQREYFLREQLKAIQKELGEDDDQQKEIAELREKIDAAGMPEAVLKEANRELDRLSRMPVAAAEYTVSRTYLDWLISLPWNARTDEVIDLGKTKRTLDHDHSGLDKAKDRILEYLAVRKLNPEMKGPILCFVGPPGVGKTSMAKSIATSLGRKFVRVSLGGMRDEAEIRGHRRTYIGALPGQVIQGLRRAESKNPVFILDEIDKLGSDFRGDPSSALLEVLDPEQNDTFRDHYLDVPFDLSEVLFITTANVMDPVPPALRDRMEVLELPGYTEEEKLLIAREHLVDKQVKNHGLSAESVTFTDDALRAVIRGYTREAGVRNLEREIGALCRKAARRRAEGNEEPLTITREVVVGHAGRTPLPRRGDGRAHEEAGRRHRPCLDAGRRRRAVHRGVAHDRWRRSYAHRLARRRDEGVRARGAVVDARQREGPGHRSRLLQERGDPPPRAVRRDPQGRAVRGRDDGDGAHLGADGPSRARRHRNDRRDHVVREGPAGRRHQGEGARGAPRRHPRGHPAEAEREERQRGPEPGTPRGAHRALCHCRGGSAGARADASASGGRSSAPAGTAGHALVPERRHPDVTLGCGLRVGDPLVVMRDADAAADDAAADRNQQAAGACACINQRDAVRSADDQVPAVGEPDRHYPRAAVRQLARDS